MSNREEQEPLRYERKFLITDYTVKDVMQIIKFHPACFTEIYHERIVNNIYFDTLGMRHYYDNVEGEFNRTKVRIRWYGDLFGNIEKPVLEYKIKQGLLGKKRSYKLSSFVLDNSFSRDKILKAVSSNEVPSGVNKEVISLKPLLLNRYNRKYYLSADKKFRVTIDWNLSYYRIAYGSGLFCNKVIDKRSVVVELKYDSELEVEAKEIASGFPFMLTKNSKYLQGLERVLF